MLSILHVTPKSIHILQVVTLLGTRFWIALTPQFQFHVKCALPWGSGKGCLGSARSWESSPPSLILLREMWPPVRKVHVEKVESISLQFSLGRSESGSCWGRMLRASLEATAVWGMSGQSGSRRQELGVLEPTETIDKKPHPTATLTSKWVFVLLSNRVFVFYD